MACSILKNKSVTSEQNHLTSHKSMPKDEKTGWSANQSRNPLLVFGSVFYNNANTHQNLCRKIPPILDSSQTNHHETDKKIPLTVVFRKFMSHHPTNICGKET